MRSSRRVSTLRTGVNGARCRRVEEHLLNISVYNQSMFSVKVSLNFLTFHVYRNFSRTIATTPPTSGLAAPCRDPSPGATQ